MAQPLLDQYSCSRVMASWNVRCASGEGQEEVAGCCGSVAASFVAAARVHVCKRCSFTAVTGLLMVLQLCGTRAGLTLFLPAVRLMVDAGGGGMRCGVCALVCTHGDMLLL